MYTSAVPESTFEKGGICITADYTLLPTLGEPTASSAVVSFAVVNSQRLYCKYWIFKSANYRVFKPDGQLKQAKGVATNKHQGHDIETGKFYLNLNGINGYYWVIELSKINPLDNKYNWAVVSAPFKSDLFILARNTTHFKEYDEKIVLEIVKKRGFTNQWNKPIATEQPAGCKYAPLPAVW